MPIERSPYLYENPLGSPMDAPPLGEDELEVEAPDGEMEIDLGETDLMGEDPEVEEENEQPAHLAPHGENLAKYLSDEDRMEIAQELLERIDEDDKSREEWMRTYKKGLKLIGLTIEERSEPWENASGVIYPMLAEAALKFQAEITVETFPASGPVLTKILGDENPQTIEIANRVREDMNYLLTRKYREFRSEHEKALWTTALAGSAFKKVYYDGALERPISKFIPPEDVIVNYGESDIFLAERVTHAFSRSRIDMKRLVANGVYVEGAQPIARDTNEVTEAKDKLVGQEESSVLDEDYQLYEVYCWLDDDDLVGPDEMPAPFIVTIDRGTQSVIGIYRNWKEGDEKKRKRQYLVHYPYILGWGFYGIGLIHIAGGFADASTSIMRQLIDAGTLSNLPGGFKDKTIKIKQDDTPLSPGEWRDVDTRGIVLKDGMIPLPYKEPSGTLHALLKDVIDAGYRVASIADLKVGDMKQDAPVGTTLALLERLLKPMTAVQARIHAALTDELNILKELILAHEPPQYEYPQAPQGVTRAQDYQSVQVLPVSDPNAATLTQRIAQFQTVQQLAATAPDIYDVPALHKTLLGHIGIKYADKFIPDKTKVEPRDPVSENMAILNGQPVKAGLTQNHEAHLQTHMMLAQDPQLTQLIGQSPNAAKIQGAMAAHIAEHVAFKYRAQMERAMGIQLPAPDQPLPPEIEVQLSALMAQAAPMVQGQSAAELAQQQAADPLFQLQEREIAVKEAEVKRKIDKDAADIFLKAREIGADGQGLLDQAQADASQRQAELFMDQQAHAQKMQQQREMHEQKMQLESVKARSQAEVAQHSAQTQMMSNEAMAAQKLRLAEQAAKAKPTSGEQVAKAKPAAGKKPVKKDTPE